MNKKCNLAGRTLTEFQILHCNCVLNAIFDMQTQREYQMLRILLTIFLQGDIRAKLKAWQ